MNSDEMLNKAIEFACKAHYGQTRKGTNTPYILHPLEATTIAATMTSNKYVIAAALLHDVLEDTDIKPEEIEAEFGKEVLILIEYETENKQKDLPAELTWKSRKLEQLEKIKNPKDAPKQLVDIVVLSDKLSNVRALYRDYRNCGPELWNRFNQKDPKEQQWYYESFIEICSSLSGSAAYEEYKELCNKLFHE